MSMILSTLHTIGANAVALGLVIVLHEFGHFVVARLVGVRVLRFSIGFGPRVLTWIRGSTEYALSAIPLGGYVKMAGEQRAERSHASWEYLSKPVSLRALIVLAGPCMNYLIALVSLWAVLMMGYPGLFPIVGEVAEGMPAQAAGLQPGDRILSVDGRPVRMWEEMTALISKAPGRALALRVERGEAVRTIEVTPKAEEALGRA
ncbi:MAG: site-2 protease family protein, partial [Elusimicrobia bacterium]|nr:site-2 protease family protein [Elusimicrobiota bacterium]